MSPSKILMSESFGKPLPGPHPTPYELIRDVITKHGSRTALVCVHQSSTLLQSITRSSPAPYLRWTYAELSRAGHAFAQALTIAGVLPGTTIATFLLNGAELWVAFFASLELNCTFAPLNPKGVGNSEETEHLLGILNPSVVLVQDVAIASKLATSVPDIMTSALVRVLAADIHSVDVEHPGWETFENFVNRAQRHDILTLPKVVRTPDDIILVGFTSGTTSLPKGCPHTNETFATMIGWAQIFGFDPARVACANLPGYHMAAFFYNYCFFITGLKVVHPATAFDPASTLKTIHLERCTDMAAVPPIIDALLAHADLRSTDISSLKNVILGATTILPETLSACMEGLGAEKVAEGFGMTECGPVIMPVFDELPCHTPSELNSSPPSPGRILRICDPATKATVAIGEPGELHIGGRHVIDRYLLSPSQGESPNDIFYKEGTVKWMASGDMAVMDHDGRVRIVGRYKDMIIRGGVNISPGAIETILSSRFNVSAEVIGVPDEFAGEVPVAIVKEGSTDGHSLQSIKEMIARELGKSIILEEVITLESLGLADYPRTTSGKVKKNKMREIVTRLRQQNKGIQAGASVDMLEIVIRVWTKILGLNTGTLTPESSVLDWADSLILARFVAVLNRENGLSITMQELLENHTIAAQAKVLSSRQSKGPAAPEFDILPHREGPPAIEDMIHTHDDIQRFRKTRQICQEVLATLKLGWTDVEDVIPMTEVSEMFSRKRRPQSSNHRHSFMCPGTSVEDANMALRRALELHPILRTMAVKYEAEVSLHVSLRPSEWVFSNLITLIDPVANASDFNILEFDGVTQGFVAAPGPMFRALITHVQDEDCAGIVYLMQHSVMDATSFPMFLEDFTSLLGNSSAKIIPRIPFKAWADSYYDLSSSASALQAVNWHKKRLSGIGSLSLALLPPQRSPEWFVNGSTGWIDSTGKPGRLRKSLDIKPTGADGITMQCHLPDIVALKRDHSIEAPQIVKAALAVINTRHTKQSVAMFAQTQAGRIWPFLPDWQNACMPSAMDVNGPTLSRVLNKITVNPNDTVLSMLQTLQDEQELLTRYSAAPIRAIVAALDEGGTKDGDIWHEAMRRQEFNWLPTPVKILGHPRLKNLRIESWDDLGILWNCRMLDQTRLEIRATWDDAQMKRSEMEGLLEELIVVVERFATKENWERKLVDVID